MKRISYSGESIATGDDIAEALVLYAAALARADSSDSVTIPSRTASGVHSVTVLVGPASQIVVFEDGEDAGEELIDEAVVRDLGERMNHVGPQRATFVSEDEQLVSLDDTIGEGSEDVI